MNSILKLRPSLLVLLTVVALPAGAALPAAPYVPDNDQVVLERLASTGETQAGLRQLRAMHAELATQPDDLNLALRFARHAISLGRQEAAPRYFGYAEFALRPWLRRGDAPADVVLIRATLRQQRHEFGAALSDLNELIAADSGNAQARLTRAVVLMVQGQPQQALHDCTALIGYASVLVATTCVAQSRSLTGHNDAAQSAMSAMLNTGSARATVAAEVVWALTVAAEIAQRNMAPAAAETWFKTALRLMNASATNDPYLLTAYADFLLSRNRAAEVPSLLAEHKSIDSALLRLAFAESVLGETEALDRHLQMLQARFDATRARGDTVHLREEAMFELRLREDLETALKLAQRNWKTQREPVDARLLMECALAADQAEAARPALDWMQRTGIQDPDLLTLANRLVEAGAAEE